MAKESMKARDAKRLKLINKYKAKREQLKKEGNYEALDKLPRLKKFAKVPFRFLVSTIRTSSHTI